MVTVQPRLWGDSCEQNFLAPLRKPAQHRRHEKAAAEYDAIRALRRLASLTQSRSNNDETAWRIGTSNGVERSRRDARSPWAMGRPVRNRAGTGNQDYQISEMLRQLSWCIR